MKRLSESKTEMNENEVVEADKEQSVFYSLEITKNKSFLIDKHSYSKGVNYIKSHDFLCNVKDKINNIFFTLCETGQIDKVTEFFDKRISPDKRPEINKKYLHDFTALHIAIYNSKLFCRILFYMKYFKRVLDTNKKFYF